MSICFVYLFKTENNRYKIGVSKDPSKRLFQLNQSSPVVISLSAKREFSSRGEAFEKERELHKFFKSKTVNRREWFILDNSDLEKLSEFFSCQNIKKEVREESKIDPTKFISESVTSKFDSDNWTFLCNLYRSDALWVRKEKLKPHWNGQDLYRMIRKCVKKGAIESRYLYVDKNRYRSQKEHLRLTDLGESLVEWRISNDRIYKADIEIIGNRREFCLWGLQWCQNCRIELDESSSLIGRVEGAYSVRRNYLDIVNRDETTIYFCAQCAADMDFECSGNPYNEENLITIEKRHELLRAEKLSVLDGFANPFAVREAV